MDEKTAREFAEKLNTFIENVVREEYEMIFLKTLLESKWGKYLVFKGGTALRLAYNSLRFSEDLDFSLTRKIDWPKLKEVIKNESKQLPAVKLKDLRDKYFTYFGLFSIKEDYLPQPFLIKIEISKRVCKWKRDFDFTLSQLSSPVTPLKTSGFVVTKKRAFLDKKKAVLERKKGRDLYDLWWLLRDLAKKTSLPDIRYDKKKVSTELKRFLPKGNWWVIAEILRKNEHQS